MNLHKIKFLSAVLAMALAVLACTINIGGPDYPSQSIPVSTEAMGELQYSMQTAVAAGVDTGQLVLVFTEPQLTSYLANKLQAQTDPLLSDPQVYLRDNQIQLFGTARQGIFEATASVILTAGVDSQGELLLELTSADFGPLPVPNGLKEIITATIQEAYTGAIGPAATGFRLETITIADGEMTITGQTR